MSDLNFLLEIGTEEIPDWMIPNALADLQKRFLAALEKFDLAAGVSCTTEATPRRLALMANGIAARQADKQETLSGPPKNVAFDAEGKPTKAAEGFAKRAGISLDQIEVGADGKIFIERKVEGRPTKDILAEVLPEVILSVYFPKTMYWGAKNGPRFIRPIRWIVALFGGEVVSFDVGGVKSGAITNGHRRLGKKGIAVTDADQYRAALAANFVILSADERRQRIVSGYEAEFPPNAAARVRPNAKLLDTLTYLTEYPTVIRGDFEERFLSLPDEVLETAMLVHQKYFSIEDSKSGKLNNSFIAVANLNGDPDGEIRRGNERVLRARFSDAEFFWNSDIKKSLADRVESLKNVTFQAQLGSYHDKTERMVALVKSLAEAADLSSTIKVAAARAATLSKCDLTTEMVGEFPELQGIMGGLYAAHQGEPQEVADAIYDHYKPIGAGDDIPRNAPGQLVAIADKLHTLGGLFRIGMLPTGSKDPFALRRAAYGIIQIVIKGELRVTIDQLREMADAGDNASALRDFFVERLRYYLTNDAGFAYDEINAVLAASDNDPVDAVRRCEAISQVRPTPDFEPLAVSFKRISNILEKAGGVSTYASKQFNVALLEDGAEKDLHAAYASLREALKKESDYAVSLERIASVRPVVDKFFDDVLVMAKDEKVRENRLTFLAHILSEFSEIANFAEIVAEG
ncbi:MAG: glycine--tRNA ligase subunit beta [Acidobacteria bacterium]|nr:glycine--tRNA ligase subunit beta [Acidobacteriota bacterium]MDA1236581.1 glycine--tRNA ligase subunit beta [Acidobacteriota bacterium]